MAARWLVLIVLLVPCRPAIAHDVEVEFTEAKLNELVRRLAEASQGGMYQPTLAVAAPGVFQECEFAGYFECGQRKTNEPRAMLPSDRIPLVRCRTRGGGIAVLPAGEPISWQWWVMDARFTIAEGRMTLAATVRWRIGDRWAKEARTVDAAFALDAANNQLRINVGAFKVPLVHQAYGMTVAITEVDVAQLLGLAIAIPPRTMQVPLIDGSGTRTLTGRATGAATDYLAGKARVKVDVAFN